MTQENKPNQVADDLVVSIDYTLTVDGEVLDSSEEEGPLEYLQGHQNIIPGLEYKLAGMEIGEKKEVTVVPRDGYGEIDEEAIVEVPLSEFPQDFPLQPGLEIEVTDKDENIMLATVLEVGEEIVRLDTNHPLAGKTLHFKVTVLDLRFPTEEELTHGHVHIHGHPHE